MSFVEGASEAVEPILESDSASSKSGLSGIQKMQAGSKVLNKYLPRPSTSHPYVVGIILLITGGFVVVGSVTGTLPSMLAGLFVPEALTDKHNNTPAPDALGVIANAAASIATPGYNILKGTW
jgi:hypothetical protein